MILTENHQSKQKSRHNYCQCQPTGCESNQNLRSLPVLIHTFLISVLICACVASAYPSPGFAAVLATLSCLTIYMHNSTGVGSGRYGQREAGQTPRVIVVE
ncbi:hypothetical protein PoB_001796300 [Plakobranchus ocellatus]|uniref:Uncharacterized protein n=1 Tax=Plakobranchus ocellatus TaxID=259542 RepID=A0AAV3Z9L5_9GAST|nr:hypothetical protein PoB_001796300 [Plakobranchus ocellatus]